MRDVLRTRATVVWCGLVVATALSLTMGHGVAFENPRDASIAIIVISVIKVRFVILDFMELRYCRRAVRAIAETWLIALGVLLILMFLWTPESAVRAL